MNKLKKIEEINISINFNKYKKKRLYVYYN